MTRLRFYTWLERAGIRNYRAKIMAMAFLGTHIPLIALAAYLSFLGAPDWAAFARTMGVTLAATLLGTGLTLLALHELLKPVSLVARALRDYRETRTVEPMPRGFGDEVGRLMEDAGDTVAHLERAMVAMETLDPATGLPNRDRTLALLAERMGAATPFALAVVRFENHSRITAALDAQRAQAGAVMLADRLRRALSTGDGRGGEGLARISPFEFAVTLDAPGADDGVRVADRLRWLVDACAEEMTVGDVAVQPELPCGVALFPGDASEPAALLDHAAAAAARGGPSAPVVLHSPEARSAAEARFRMEEELRHAVARDELELHYQPVVDTAAGRVAGAEALVRWRHPERGMISPGVFVPVAESAGLIDEMGLWILRRACDQARLWADAGHDRRIAVNLSARQFADPDLRRHVEGALGAAGISPDRIEVELTETAAMADHDRSRAVLTELRDLGVGVAIDDFGTGHASLSWLRRLPFTKLKIDREFVTDVETRPASQAICGALIELSRGLDLRVLAEGTETAAEVAHLRGRGCDLFQGFHFSRPVPAAQFEDAASGILRGLGDARAA